MKKNGFVWALTGVSAVVGFMLTVQLSSKPQVKSGSLSNYLDLRTQIQEQLQEHKILMQDISKQSAQLVQYRAAEGHRSDMLKVLQQDAKNVEQEAGRTPVSGSGITIQIQYDPNLPYNAKTAGLFDQIADQELGLIVNDLYANGARAISINGQRLVTTSSIRLVSGLSGIATLQVNTVPVTMPYVLTAVGDVSRMEAILTLNDVKQQLEIMQERCTITPYTGKQQVTVPAYDGPLPGTWAKEVSN
jgi:uncharacterized protein YlxW (UPF0749 family)